MKNRNLRSIIRYGAAVLGMALMLGGCGEQAVESSAPSSQAVESSTVAEDVVKEPAKNAFFESMVGEWELLAEVGEEYVYTVDESESIGSLVIYQEGDKYRADYYLSAYESGTEIYGAPLKEESGTYFQDYFKADKYALMDRKSEYGGAYSIKTNDDGTLLLQYHRDYSYTYDDGEVEEYFYDAYYVYSKKDAPNRAELMDSYRYKQTVTVTNAVELYNAIHNNTHIILKAGTYNLSTILDRFKNNEDINYYYYDGEYCESYGDSIYVPYLRDIFIEGEEGAEVLICTEDPGVAPLEFYNCNNIILKNLTVGHEVEPGHCSGSVLCFDSSYTITIENCRLYGSGTYGIEAYGCSNLDVKDCDIYECTEGLVSLPGSYYVEFSNCKLRDSSEYSMINLPDAYYVDFNHCSFTGNRCLSEFNPFIYAGDAFCISFTDCTFRDNYYSELYAGEVIMTRCVIDDNK
ncbi:MAG: right-handed parallel beta-helix repeat-containing protein [Acetatifactor sp.]|nr:right-handed parallel beta-helix repeat-containing protein [Acetatifactor sp.]